MRVHFASGEQDPVDRTTDIFSFGCFNGSKGGWY